MLGRTVTAFSNTFDIFYTSEYNQQHILDLDVGVSMLTNIIFLCIVLTIAQLKIENKPMKILKSAKHAYHYRETNDISVVHYKFNTADGIKNLKPKFLN